MSLPIIFGAGLLKIGELSQAVSWMNLLVGFLSSAIFGFLAIKFLLKYLARNDFKLFVWYRLGLAGLILLWYFVKI